MRIFLLSLFLCYSWFSVNAADQDEEDQLNGLLFQREKFVDHILPEINEVKSASEEFSEFLDEMDDNKELTEEQYQDICSRMEVFMSRAFSFLRDHSKANESIMTSLTDGTYLHVENFHFYEEFFGVDFVSELINLESRMLIGYTFCSDKAINHVKVVRWTFLGLSKDDGLQGLKRNQQEIESIINGIVSSVIGKEPNSFQANCETEDFPYNFLKTDSFLRALRTNSLQSF